MRWIKRAFVAGPTIYSLLLIFLTGFTAYVRSDYTRSFVEERLSTLIPGSVAWRAFHVSPLDGSFEVRGLVLKGLSGEAVAGCERVFAEVSWRASLTEMVTFESIRLEKPWARILVDEQGGINIQQALAVPETGEKSPGKKLPVNVVVRSFEVAGGDVTFDMPSRKWGTAARNIDLMASGNLGQKVGNFKLHIERLRVNQAGREKAITGLGFTARLERSRLSQIQAWMRLDASRIDVAGHIEDLFAKPRFDLAAELSLVLPGLLDGLAVAPRIAGSVAGKFFLKGTADDPEATLALHSNGLRLGELKADRAAIAGTFKKRLLTLEKLSLAGEALTVEGSGVLDLAADRIEGHLAMESPDLAPVLAPFGSADVTGSARLRMDLAGQVQHPAVFVEVSGKRLHVGEQTVGDVHLVGNLDDTGTFQLTTMTLTNRESRVTGNGHLKIYDKDLFGESGLRLSKDPAFVFEVAGKSILIQNFMDAARGSFAVSAQLKGHLSKPTGSITLEGAELDVGGQALDGLALKATVDGERFWIRPAQLTVAAGETVTVNGWISLDAAYDLAVVSQGVSLDSIDYFKKIGITAGTFQCDLSGSGTWQDPRAKGSVMFEDMRLRGQPLENVRLDIGIENHRVHFASQAPYEISGTYHIIRRDLALSARFREADLGPYFKVADQPEFTGTVTGSIDAQGNSAAPADFEADCDIQALALFWQGNDLLRAQQLKATVKKGHLDLIPVDLQVGQGGTLRLGGVATYGGALDLRAEGEIPLAALQPFVEEAVPDLKGRLILTGSVTGTHREPRVQALVDLSQAAFTVPGLLQKMDNIEGRLRIVPDRVDVDYLRGRSDTGRFELSGGVDVASFRPQKILLRLKAEALPVRVPDTLDLLLNADLVMDGTAERAQIQGEVVVLEGDYRKDVQISLLDMATKRERLFTPPPEQAHPFVKNTGLDIAIKRRNNLIVDNNVAHLEINPDLRITGKLGNPVIRGRATVEAGTLMYRKKTFDVKKGYVDFSNPYRTEPYIDIESETKVRGWTIWLALAGTPDALSFKLTSDPPEANGDILSLLVVGRTTRELAAGEGGASRSPVQLLAEVVAGTLSEDLKDATGLDTLEIVVGDEKGADTVKVTVGKDLSKRLSVKYATESKEGLLIQRAIAEYKFLEHFLVSSSQDTEGIFGGEVKFRLEFR